MALLPNFTPFVSGTKNNPAGVNTPMQNIHNLLGTASSAPTFSDANVATGAAINPAKISGTAMVLASAGTQTVTKATNFSVESLTSSLGVTAGTYTGGTITTNVTAATSAGASTLMTYTLPANTLTTTLRGLRIRAWGTKASTANPATVQLQFGGSAIASKVLPTTAVGLAVWEFEARVLRTGLNAQLFVGDGWHNQGTSVSGTDAALVQNSISASTLAITETSSIVIRVQATAATTTEVIQLGMHIETI